MTAVNLVKQTANDIVSYKPKGLEEGAAGGDDTQILIENHEWIADGIDDGLRKRESVPDINERCGFRRKRREHMNLSPPLFEQGLCSANFPKRMARTPKDA
ncbi:MAG: hypothetical protein WB037_07765 [Pseudolabrys sp.]